MVVNAIPIWEVEAVGLRVQSHSLLQKEFEVSLGYMKSFLLKKELACLIWK